MAKILNFHPSTKLSALKLHLFNLLCYHLCKLFFVLNSYLVQVVNKRVLLLLIIFRSAVNYFISSIKGVDNLQIKFLKHIQTSNSA